MNVSVPPIKEKVVNQDGKLEHSLAFWLEAVYQKVKEIQTTLDDYEERISTLEGP